MAPADYAGFCRELHTLLAAGMTVVEAVDTLAHADERVGLFDAAVHRAGAAPSASASLAQTLMQGLLRGQSLSAALSFLHGVPPVLVAAVQAGEHTSDLPRSLADFLRFDELMRRLRQKVLSAALYPALVTALGLGVCVFLVLVVLPNFARVYAQVHGEVGGAAAVVVRFALAVTRSQPEWWLSAAVALACAVSWWRGGGARRAGALLLRRLGFLRRRARDFEWAVLHQATALLLRGGYTLPAALRTAAASALSQTLAAAARDALQRIEAGGAVSAAFHEHGLCDEIDRRLIAAAERSGEFHRVLDSIARRHAERFELFVERATRIVEPVLLLAVALVVGGVVVAMYLPVFDLAVRLR